MRTPRVLPLLIAVLVLASGLPVRAQAPSLCGGRVATHVGTDADETITGSDGDDVVVAGGGADTVFGMSGNDTICGGPGDDLLLGGGGDDILLGELDADRALGESGADILSGGPGDDVLDGGEGDDKVQPPAAPARPLLPGPREPEAYVEVLRAGIRGGPGDDLLIGGSGSDWLYGEAGEDRLRGDAGDDVLDGGTEDDDLDGGPGDEVVVSFESQARPLLPVHDPAHPTTSSGLRGGPGDDLIHGGDGQDWAVGGDGNDTLFGDDGPDFLDGGDGDDELDGGPGEERTHSVSVPAKPLLPVGGRDGNVVEKVTVVTRTIDAGLVGGAGNDTLRGGPGGDSLEGDEGDDKLWGDEGDDLLSGGSGNDELFGGEGDEQLPAPEPPARPLLPVDPEADQRIVRAGMVGGPGDDRLDGGPGADIMVGGDGGDHLVGGDGPDLLDGGPGDDALLGSSGNDELYGRDGTDYCGDQEGTDTCDGGSPTHAQPASDVDLCSMSVEERTDCRTGGVLEGQIHIELTKTWEANYQYPAADYHRSATQKSIDIHVIAPWDAGSSTWKNLAWSSWSMSTAMQGHQNAPYWPARCSRNWRYEGSGSGRFAYNGVIASRAYYDPSQVVLSFARAVESHPRLVQDDHGCGDEFVVTTDATWPDRILTCEDRSYAYHRYNDIELPERFAETVRDTGRPGELELDIGCTASFPWETGYYRTSWVVSVEGVLTITAPTNG